MKIKLKSILKKAYEKSFFKKFKEVINNPKTFVQANKIIIKNSNINKEVIKSTISHLNGYILILENRNIPPLAVEENIKELKKIIKRGLK